MPKPKAIAIVGPTASGKTSLSIAVAKRYNGEVVSADSRQIYRGLNLGTGKVTPEEMEDIPHHLLDIRDPIETYTGAEFKHDAEVALRDILTRNHLPIVAGGTQFYVELLQGTMSAAPVEPNPELRAHLETVSTEELFDRLKQKDPHRADTIDRENRRRLVRSLEIIAALGHVPEATPTESEYDWLNIGVTITKEQLHHNIHVRLAERIEAGMVEEAEQLHAAGMTYTRMDELGLEYRYLAKHLQGELSLDAMTEQLETKIRQYAKRQMTWLKRSSTIHWHDPKDHAAIFHTIDRFLSPAAS